LNPVSAWPAIAALVLALVTTLLLVKRFGEAPAAGRFVSIDGVRGFLAFFVFLHHSCIWYFYLRTGKWEVPPSNLYTHFGQSSVALFFMITGFLFYSKLIDGRAKKIDWLRLFVSRFLRLAPLYFFVMFLLFAAVFILSKATLNEPVSKLLFGMIRWLGFTLLGAPDLNGVGSTRTIVADVVWSLPYEWMFYFSLPLMALTVGVLAPFRYLGFSLIGVALIIWYPSSNYLPFLGGIIAAILVRFEWICKLSTSKPMSFLALVFLATAVGFFPSAYAAAPLLLLGGFFAIIACGNTLFGLLKNRVSRTLGEFAYGIYLMHGITLFVTFNFILGLQQSRALSVVQHWTVVAGITPVLIFICFLLFRFIEKPAMQKATSMTIWLRSFSRRATQRAVNSQTELN
jgi:peptidoglycan/LPS O-acetylase OafA/YrhL